MAAKKKSSRTPARKRASSSTTRTKTPVKVSSASKGSGRSSSSKTSTRTPKKTSTTRRPAKKTTARKNVKKVTKPQNKKPGPTREFDPVTGFAVDSDSHFIAQAIIDGGETRQDIIDWLKENMDTETRNGTDKPVANLFAGVYNKLLARGFTLESSFRLVPPTKSSAKSRSRR